MSMAKFLLTKASIVVNSIDLSNFAFSLETPETKEQVDVSGFNPAGTREYLPGQSDQTITVGFLQGFGTNEPHRVLQPLYTGGSSFPIKVMADSSQPASVSNPTFGGTATLYDYNGLNGQLNARGEISATFRPTGAAGFTWGTT
jgi:hypothetical protein